MTGSKSTTVTSTTTTSSKRRPHTICVSLHLPLLPLGAGHVPNTDDDKAPGGSDYIEEENNGENGNEENDKEEEKEKEKGKSRNYGSVACTTTTTTSSSSVNTVNVNRRSRHHGHHHLEQANEDDSGAGLVRETNWHKKHTHKHHYSSKKTRGQKNTHHGSRNSRIHCHSDASTLSRESSEIEIDKSIEGNSTVSCKTSKIYIIHQEVEKEADSDLEGKSVTQIEESECHFSDTPKIDTGCINQEGGEEAPEEREDFSGGRKNPLLHK
ncbi:hypothetical protein Pelo_15637 [Pelomyxa schiedti]|nr:hypothetical protein Pelo_15637 [Pelomyxa schiedti]